MDTIHFIHHIGDNLSAHSLAELGNVLKVTLPLIQLTIACILDHKVGYSGSDSQHGGTDTQTHRSQTPHHSATGLWDLSENGLLLHQLRVQVWKHMTEQGGQDSGSKVEESMPQGVYSC